MIATFEKNLRKKRFFDVTNPDDIELFRKFMKDDKWTETGCPFILENPYLSVPHMIQDKIVKNVLRI